MNVELGLKKIESLELDKKNLLVKLFDTNELLNNVKTENMLLLDKTENMLEKMHGKLVWVCHFLGKSGHLRPNCYKLQAAKRANKSKVSVPQAQYPITLIGELVKAFNLYSNLGVGNHSNLNANSNARGASKRFWMQKTRSN